MSKDAKINEFKTLQKAFSARYKAGHKDGYAKGRVNGICSAVENYSAVVILCLKDKFEFDNDQLKEITDAINETFHCICLGRLSFDDIKATVKEENNLEIGFNGGDVILKEADDDESLQTS